MAPQIPFVLHPRASATPFPCFQNVKSTLPVVSSDFIPSPYLPLASVIATRAISNMPATSSPRQITEARTSATNFPYGPRLITYSRRDQKTKSRRALSGSSYDEPMLISDSDDDFKLVMKDTSSKGKGKGKGKGKAKATTPESFSDDDVVIISGPAKASSSRQTNVQEMGAVNDKAKNIFEQMFTDFLRKQEENLSCQICMEIVNNPHVLWCGHFFCAECLTGHAKALVKQRDNPRCPTCRVIHGRFKPAESYVLREQAYDLRQALQIPQPERGKLKWPEQFIPTERDRDEPLPFRIRPTDTLF
ncbi:hypothetical protein FB446DRAFT_793849 [Lentinula raphanica]|nr:hypothetical protein FB446DRAFT_793849 [Lentinula raphanica]